VHIRARCHSLPLRRRLREPIPESCRTAAAYPRRVLPSCPLAIPSDSPARGRNVHRPPYCCVLPVVTLRVLTAADLLPAHIQRRPASRNISSSCTSCCSQQSNRRTSECAIRLCRCYGYRAGQQRAVARRCASSLRRHNLGQVLGNLFALVFFRVRRPFVFRTEISLPCRPSWSPIPKRVHSVAVCRTSCNVPSVVCCKDASIVIEC
jgi:hypothetical protein